MAKKDKYSSRNTNMNYTYMDDSGAITTINNATQIITNTNYNASKLIKNITLTDYLTPIKVLGSTIIEDAKNNPNIDSFGLPDIDTTSITNDKTYNIYGSPEKWVLKNHQSYNNCGVMSSLNVLVMAGKMTITDQTKTEKQFTKKIWDLGLCQDAGIYGVLDKADGGTTLNYYEKILKLYDIKSTPKGYGGDEKHYTKVDDEYKPVTLQELATAVQSGKGIIMGVASDILWGEINTNINNNIKISAEALVTNTKIEASGGNPDCFKFNYTSDIATGIPKDAEFYRIDETYFESDYTNLISQFKNIYGNDKTPSDYFAYTINDTSSNTYAFISGDNMDKYNNENINHAICLTGVVTSEDNTNIIGFYIQDTGAWATRYISVNDLADAALAYRTIVVDISPAGDNSETKEEQHNVFCTITDDNIKSLTDATNVTGNNLDNIITANSLDNLIKAQKGNDTVYGGNGADTIYGGNGNDLIYGYLSDIGTNVDGANKIYGEAGNDTIYGGNNNDTIDGGNGNDTIYGYLGNDFIKGGSGNDSLCGDKDDSSDYTGNDTIYGGNGNDKIYGNLGDDLLYGDNGNDEIYGGKGEDIIYGGTGNDTIHGMEDNDIIYGGAGNDSLIGDAGDDRIFGQSGKNTISGAAGEDTLIGGTGNDTIDGGVDDDCISGGKGNDSINGGTGNDFISGDTGNDIIYGNENNDIIFGDTYKVDDNDDSLPTGSGNDTIYGGIGNDTIYTCGGNDVIYAEENDGDDKIYFGSGTNTYIIDYHTYGKDTLEGAASKYTTTVQYNNISAYELNYSMSLYSNKENYVIDIVLKEDSNNSLTFKEFQNTSKIKTYIIDETKTKYLLSANEDNGNIVISNTKSNNIFVTADENSNDVTTTKYSDIVYLSDENDTISYTGGKDYYISTSGNDTYYCNIFDKNTFLTIIDGKGNDSLNITADKSDMKLLFDWKANTNETSTIYNDLFILNKEIITDYDKLVKNFNGEVGGGIDIYNYSSTGTVKTIKDSTGQLNIITTIDNIKSAIATWYVDTGSSYTDKTVMEIFNDSNIDASVKETLFTCFDKPIEYM